jgi:hypothetical protein
MVLTGFCLLFIVIALVAVEHQVWAEQSVKAVKNDDIFDASVTGQFQRGNRGSAAIPSLLMMDCLVPDISSPVVSKSHAGTSHSNQSTEASPAATQLFQSNRVHKIHNRIRPQLIASLPAGDRRPEAAEGKHSSIEQLRKTIGTAVEDLKRDFKKKSHKSRFDESDGESLGDDDTDDNNNDDDDDDE